MSYTEEVPMHSYEGDEFISQQSYRACMQGKYGSLVPGFIGATSNLGLSVDLDTAERWKRVAVAGGMLDTFLDDSPDREAAVDLYKQGIGHIRNDYDKPKLPYWADEQLEPMMQLLDNSIRTLPDERKDVLLNAAEIIADISLEKTAITSVSAYIQLLRLEGQLSGLLFSESASDAVYKQPGYDRFATWVFKLMEAGTLVDSAIDINRDRIAGLTFVNPTNMNQARLAVSGLAGLYAVVHGPNLRTTLSARRAVKAHQLHR